MTPTDAQPLAPEAAADRATAPASGVLNVMSVDLEDWHQLASRRVRGGLGTPTRNVFRQMDALLALLDRHEVTATFFTMGALAEAFPEIVRRVAEAGHEVACHGHDHLIVHRLSPEAFREDTRRAKETLESIAGAPVVGFRAPEFSINRRTLWALDVLADLGFTYDSSIFPIHHRRYGIPEFSPEPTRYALPGGGTIAEFPLSTTTLRGNRIPVAGGGYFRYLPGAALERVTRNLNADGLPLVTYFHPYEYDPQRLRAADEIPLSGWRQRLRASVLDVHQNVGRASLAGKVERLLATFPFGPFRDALRTTDLPGPVPLPTA